MTGYRSLRLLPILAAVLLASGCAYPIAKQYRDQARRLSVGMVAENPAAYKGATVIWGGVIVRIEHQGGPSSTLLIEQYPLDIHGQPRDWSDPGGRFLIRSDSYLDPTIYKKGRWVTAAGEITGVIWERQEKVQYRYPDLALRQIHLWPEYARTYDPYYDYYYAPYWYGWGRPWGSYPYYGPYGYPHFYGWWW